MGSRHHRELIVPVTQGELPVAPPQEFLVPSDVEVIDVLEDERDIDVERTQ